MSEIDEAVGKFFAEALDVHCAARDEMIDMALELSRAGRVRAVASRFTFSSMRRRSANRAVDWHDELMLVSGSPLDDDLHHLGDDIPCSLHDHRVTDSNVFAADLIFVVERGTADHHAANVDRLQ